MRYLVGLSKSGYDEDYLYTLEAQNTNEMWLKLAQYFYNDIETVEEAKQALTGYDDLFINFVYNATQNRLVYLNEFAFEWVTID